ncbi:arylsulfatase [Paenibacillus thermotolerans]|uniref:arylsulfatase n=1 Tax=Paenibacillus thermotolerans TaxID=3027807 RepID=UPI002367E120|nr:MULTISPECIES: arylsulfatase [unclassified Paenibacillus]
MSERPNLLLISVDQMRGDCLSVLDHPIVQTPNLDQLSRSGVLFRRAYTSAPSCIPARAAIFTGMSPARHGRVGYQDKVPWNYEHTLPGELTKAGYQTQCVGKMHVYPARNRCGFDNVVLHDGYLHYNRNRSRTSAAEHYDSVDDYVPWLRERAGSAADLLDLGLDCNASTMARPWHLPEALHPTNWTVAQSAEFLRRRDPTSPFFLWMSFVRPHPPFDPPQAYLDLYDEADIPDPIVGEWAETLDPNRSGLDPITASGIVPSKRLKKAMAAYYALITHVDHQIGRFLQLLDEYGLTGNTIILFVSDHGELLGDHNLFRKSLPYEGSANVPFIVADPGNRLGLKRGSVVDRVVELRDIMPTLLDAAGVPIPDTVEGASLLPISRGEAAAWREYIHGEHLAGHQSNHYLTDGKDKYIWFSQTGAEQLFDLAADPNELVDLAQSPEHARRLDAWRSRLIAELNGREEGYSDGRRLFAGRKAKPVLDHVLAMRG